MDGATENANKKRKLDEPYVRTKDHILRKFNGRPPSLTIHLHQTHFKFEGQDGSFAYDSEMKFILEHVRRGTMPHQMMQELLENSAQFYDGCLIVEVHNHRAKEGKDKGRHDSAADEDTVKFSMHNYNEHVTPSPNVPYPSKARTGDTPEKNERSSIEMPAPERPKEKEGPKIFTTVLFPTPLSQHHEINILANTPASEVRNKKRDTIQRPSSYSIAVSASDSNWSVISRNSNAISENVSGTRRLLRGPSRSSNSNRAAVVSRASGQSAGRAEVVRST